MRGAGWISGWPPRHRVPAAAVGALLGASIAASGAGETTPGASSLRAALLLRALGDDDILPRMDEWEVFPRVAVAAGLAAQQEGIARLTKSREVLHREAARTMREAREAVGLLMRGGLIAPPPGS